MKHKIGSIIIIFVLLSALIYADETKTEVLKKKPVNIVTLFIEDSNIVAHFFIPEGMHQTLQKDYFYLDVEPIDGVIFEETIYPEGHEDEDGYINFEKEVTLTKKFDLKDGIQPENIEIVVYAGYQYCYETYCEPPVEVEFNVNLVEYDK